MADSATRAQRASALEEKRRKLEEMKQRRTRRDEDTAKLVASSTAATSATSTSSSFVLDEYIDGLLKQPPPAVTATRADDDIGTIGRDQPPAPPTTRAEELVNEGSLFVDNQDEASSPVMGSASLPSVPSASRTIETFSVAIQTDESDVAEILQSEPDEEDAAALDDNQNQNLLESSIGDTPQGGYAINASISQGEDPRVLSIDEVQKEVASKPFLSFISTASKKVERLLGQAELSELLDDYMGVHDGAPSPENKDADGSRFLTSRQIYECVKWTSGRDVTDLDWSSLQRDLLLSTYHVAAASSSGTAVVSKGSTAVSVIAPNDTLSSSMTPRSGELQSDGLALVWSLSMPNRPEHIFTCGSPVTCGRFHPTESPLVIGGCESGQLVVWDIRAGRLPVQKSALISVVGASSKGHTHPINCMEISEGGLGLVTASNDGKVNFWSLANLREPVETVQISDSISCFAVAPESETLILGDENGALYSLPSLLSSQSGAQRSSSRRQVRKLASTDGENESMGHYGMITSLSTKTLKKSVASRTAGLAKGFLLGSGGLVLTAGVDWTVKLWSPAISDTPLLSLVSHSYDYMSDVKWCPYHPALFATASSNGTIGLWNLTVSLEEPITGLDGIVVEPDAMSGRGLNKLSWSPDGRRLAVSSSDRVHVLTIADDYIQTKGDEDSRIMNQLMARGLIGRV